MANSTQTPQDLPTRTQPGPQEDTSPPSPTSASAQQRPKPKSKPPPRIHTYHCLCTHLLFASTHNLSTLPHRQSPGLDSAIIVPLPVAPLSTTSPSSPSSSSSDEVAPHKPRKSRKSRSPLSYTLLLSTTQDRKPHMIARADGFEKRYLWRCGRCRLIVGYQLDDVHFPAGEGAGEEGEDGGKARGRVLYLLPGGLMTTEEMAAGKAWGDKDIELGGGGE